MARRCLTDEEISSLLQEDSESDNSIHEHDVAVTVERDFSSILMEDSDSSSSDDNTGVDVPAVVMQVQVPRRQLMKNRIVNSLKKSLSPSSYNRFSLPEEEVVHKVVLEKGTKTKAEKSISWTNRKPTQIGRQANENIIRTKGGSLNDAKNARQPIESWELFFSDDITNCIVSCTNKKIEEKILQVGSEKKKPYHKLTEVSEIKAFLGLLYARGLMNLNHQNAANLFLQGIGHPIFTATMSHGRFTFLHSTITFDDFETRNKRFQGDRFAAIRNIFEMFNNNCSKALQPNEYLTIDETLYGCRNQVSFRQYNASKPEKYGILFKSINSVDFAYTHRAVVYSGKPVGDPGPYYVPGIIPIVQRIVSDLMTYVDLGGRNISMDRLYTSIELAQWLLERNITVVGTLMANKKGIPAAVKSVEGRENYSYQVYWETENMKLTLHSYVVRTKSKGMKNVLVLSSVPPILGITKDDGKCKPAVIKFYDFSKGGTDIVDQRIGSYSVNTKSRKWTLAVLAYMLDTARINSQTIFALNNELEPRKTSSFKFGWHIVNALVTPHLHIRKQNIHLQKSILNKIVSILNEPETTAENASEEQYEKVSEKRARCSVCLKNAYGKDFDMKKQSIPKVQIRCTKCGKPTCKPHIAVQRCTTCDSIEN